MIPEITKATVESLYMIFVSGLLSIAIGMPLGILLYTFSISRRLTSIYRVMDVCVNIFRSIPFIILILLLIPVTRRVSGTIIGPNAAIFNLTVAAVPFFGRLTENALNTLPKGVSDSAQAMGVSYRQFVLMVLVPETLPEHILNASVLLINLVTYTAIAGAVGAGGLGQLAINYGYYRFQWDVVLYSVIILVLISQVIQLLGTRVAKILRK
ncbi:MAG TPA: methionine ABC transporter permease [Kosmotogaceae bacterium]|nr:MAG: ABC-type metal ion transport system, permease component [Thermotogales bacterium 46_20]HAA86591.1 methionine ABC transporter permease [Kosmotogaceae bacterium]